MHIETSAGFFLSKVRKPRAGGRMSQSYLKLIKCHSLHSNPYFLKSFSEQMAATRLFISMEFINAYSDVFINAYSGLFMLSSEE